MKYYYNFLLEKTKKNLWHMMVPSNSVHVNKHNLDARLQIMLLHCAIVLY
jgi:hypothetical protein